VACPRTQQADLPAYLHTIPLMLNVKLSSMEAVNNNFANLLVSGVARVPCGKKYSCAPLQKKYRV